MDKEKDPMIASSEIDGSLTSEEDRALEGELQAVFETMTAPEALKARTLAAMHAASEETVPVTPSINTRTVTPTTTSSKSFKKTFTLYRRRFVALVAAACLVFACFGGGVAYATETAYVSIESTPSIELALNCFNIVVKTTATNAAGTELLGQANVQNKSYDEAVRILIQTAQSDGMISGSDVVAVTVASNDGNQANGLMNKAQSTLASLNCNATYAETNVETREEAQETGLSTGKYRAYLELQSLGVPLSIEDCANMTMPQLKAAIDAASKNANTSGNGNASGQNSGNADMSGQVQSGGSSSGQSGGSSGQMQSGDAGKQQGKS
jgi:uncharacterized membrane protein YgcG